MLPIKEYYHFNGPDRDIFIMTPKQFKEACEQVGVETKEDLGRIMNCTVRVENYISPAMKRAEEKRLAMKKEG